MIDTINDTEAVIGVICIEASNNKMIIYCVHYLSTEMESKKPQVMPNATPTYTKEASTK